MQGFADVAELGGGFLEVGAQVEGVVVVGLLRLLPGGFEEVGETGQQPVGGVEDLVDESGGAAGIRDAVEAVGEVEEQQAVGVAAARIRGRGQGWRARGRGSGRGRCGQRVPPGGLAGRGSVAWVLVVEVGDRMAELGEGVDGLVDEMLLLFDGKYRWCDVGVQAGAVGEAAPPQDAVDGVGARVGHRCGRVGSDVDAHGVIQHRESCCLSRSGWGSTVAGVGACPLSSPM